MNEYELKLSVENTMYKLSLFRNIIPETVLKSTSNLCTNGSFPWSLQDRFTLMMLFNVVTSA